MMQAKSNFTGIFEAKNAVGGGEKAKRAKTVLSWDRDIICFPNYSKKATAKAIPYPRGKM